MLTYAATMMIYHASNATTRLQ